MSDKEFYVDFGSWNITAKDETKVREEVERRIIDGDIPTICNIEDSA